MNIDLPMIFDRLGPILTVLRPYSRRLPDRYARGTRLGRGAPALIHSVSDALQEAPQLFQELPPGTALRERQSRAYDLQCLHYLFLSLSEWAKEAYIYEQSEATEEALTALRLCAQTWDADLRDARARALDVAFDLLPKLGALSGRKKARKRGRPKLSMKLQRSPSLESSFQRAWEVMRAQRR